MVHFPNQFMQAFIHPFLARLFWSTPIVTGDVNDNTTYTLSNWSPYGYCSGTYVLDRNHTYIKFADVEPGHNIFYLTFIDFAGSGLVHVCGKSLYSMYHQETKIVYEFLTIILYE